jgi:hypothetical protein
MEGVDGVSFLEAGGQHHAPRWLLGWWCAAAAPWLPHSWEKGWARRLQEIEKGLDDNQLRELVRRGQTLLKELDALDEAYAEYDRHAERARSKLDRAGGERARDLLVRLGAAALVRDERMKQLERARASAGQEPPRDNPAGDVSDDQQQHDADVADDDDNTHPHLELMHLCHTSTCCRPGHLLVGTASENQRDRARRSRNGGARGSRTSTLVVLRRVLRFAGKIDRRPIAITPRRS